MTSHEREPPPPSRVLIACTCLTHGGAVNFTNATLTQINGDIELDPHAVRACVLRFDEDGATALRDTLMAWLGWEDMSQDCPGCGRRGAPAPRAWLCQTCGMSHAAQVPNPATTVVVALPLRELAGLDVLASVALASWTCRLCGTGGSGATTPAACRDATAHLITRHHAAISSTQVPSSTPDAPR